jgi:hypothetical protein
MISIKLKKKVKVDNLNYGMSSLHAWIRFFELGLNVSYRLDFKKWQARGDADKEQKNTAKKNSRRFSPKIGPYC